MSAGSGFTAQLETGDTPGSTPGGHDAAPAIRTIYGEESGHLQRPPARRVSLTDRTEGACPDSAGAPGGLAGDGLPLAGGASAWSPRLACQGSPYLVRGRPEHPDRGWRSPGRPVRSRRRAAGNRLLPPLMSLPARGRYRPAHSVGQLIAMACCDQLFRRSLKIAGQLRVRKSSAFGM